MELERPLLSVIVPAFNERQRLPAFLASVRAYLDYSFAGPYEVIAVDDGSSDGTLAFLEGETARWSELSFVRHIGNLGKGAAVRSGMQVARGTYWLFADADGATPINEESRLRRAIDAGAQVAIGCRAARARLESTVPRRIAARVFAAWSHLATGLPIVDTQCGFKMFHSSVGHLLFSELREAGFAFDVELLVRASLEGYRIVEVPVVYRDVPGSKVRIARDSFQMFKSLIRIRRQMSRLARLGQRRSAGRHARPREVSVK